MSADSRLLVQAVREGINREHLLLNDVDGQLGWSRDKTKNVFSGRTKLSGDDVLDILSNPNVPIPDFKRYRMFLRIRQALLTPAEDGGVNYRDGERRGLDVGVTPATLP